MIHTQRETASGSDIQITFDVRKLLNKKLKPDKESEKRGDIVLLSEIMTNSIYGKLCPPAATIKMASDTASNRPFC